MINWFTIFAQWFRSLDIREQYFERSLLTFPRKRCWSKFIGRIVREIINQSTSNCSMILVEATRKKINITRTSEGLVWNRSRVSYLPIDSAIKWIKYKRFLSCCQRKVVIFHYKYLVILLFAVICYFYCLCEYISSI